jgi:hypothetical protein
VTAFDRIRDRLREHGSQVRDTGKGQAMAQCPAHDDRNPSLALTEIPDRVLIHCHAGCDTPDVLAAIGLTNANLFDDPRGVTYSYPDGRYVHRTPDKQSGSRAIPRARPCTNPSASVTTRRYWPLPASYFGPRVSRTATPFRR